MKKTSGYEELERRKHLVDKFLSGDGTYLLVDDKTEVYPFDATLLKAFSEAADSQGYGCGDVLDAFMKHYIKDPGFYYDLMFSEEDFGETDEE